MATVITYGANPADFPELQDTCEAGGLHEWERLNPFTTNKIQESVLAHATHKCPRCQQFAKIPARGNVAPEWKAPPQTPEVNSRS